MSGLTSLPQIQRFHLFPLLRLVFCFTCLILLNSLCLTLLSVLLLLILDCTTFLIDFLSFVYMNPFPTTFFFKSCSGSVMYMNFLIFLGGRPFDDYHFLNSICFLFASSNSTSILILYLSAFCFKIFRTIIYKYHLIPLGPYNFLVHSSLIL